MHEERIKILRKKIEVLQDHKNKKIERGVDITATSSVFPSNRTCAKTYYKFMAFL